MRGVENVGCGKGGVWKMRSMENEQKISIFHFNMKLTNIQFSVSVAHSNAGKQCVNNKKVNKNKKTRCINAF